MLQRVKEVQESDLRMDGALAHNIQRVLAVTQADIDAAAAQGKGWLVKRVVKVNDPLDNMRGGTQLVIKQNAILPGQNVMRVMYVGGQAVVVGPGTSPLSLPDAVAEDVMSLIAYGGTEQRNLPSGYTQMVSVANMASTLLDTGLLPTVDDIEFEIRVKPSTGSWYIFQSRPVGGNITGISGSSSGQTITFSWSGTALTSSITRDTSHIFYVKGTAKNGVITLYVKDETAGTEDTQTGSYTFSAPTSNFYLWGNEKGDKVAANNWVYYARMKVGGQTVMDYVPCMNGSNVLGFYDKATQEFKTKTSSTGGLTADQTVVPTPTAPMDIVCNNGVLKYRDTELPVGYRRILGMTMNNNCYYEITGFKMNGSDTLRFSFTRTGANACNVLGAYDGTSAQSNYSLYAASSNSSYLRYNGGTYNSYAIADKKYNVVLTPTGSDGMETDSTWTAKTFTSTTNLCIGTTSPSATSSKMVGDIHGSVVVDSRLELIPCERVSDSEIGYYDPNTGTFYEPIGTTPISLGYDYSHYAVITDGTVETINIHTKNLSPNELDNVGYTSTGGTSSSSTFCGNLHKIKCAPGDKFTVSCGNFPDGISGVFINTWKTDGTWNQRQAIAMESSYTYTIPAGVGEVNFTLYKTGGITIGDSSWLQVERGNAATTYQPYFDGGSAVAEMLLSVGDYTDEQEVISGAVTRKVGIKVLDGTENVGTSNATFTIAISDRVASKTPLICSHFQYSNKTSSQTEDLTVISFSSTNIGFRYDACANAAAFKTWLANQYAAGTPVIVVYQLAAETTESVAGQPLETTDGDNIAEITQASMDGLELEVEYIKEE